MGMSTDGQLCFGIKFEEDYEFPWNSEAYDNDMDDWWIKLKGFNCFSPYDTHGEYLLGFNRDSPETNHYFTERRKFLEANPVPVRLVNYCSSEGRMFILATKSFTAYRGYPKEITMDMLKDTEADTKLLLDFCKEATLDTEETPKWWLSSYWG
jgi:hypothetical protein